MGKGGGGGSATAAMVDPTAAMASYQKGADIIEKQFPVALQQFISLANQGLSAQLQQYADASAQSAPYSQTALDAINELRFMTGMAPVSKSVGLTDKVGAISQSLGNLRGVSTYNSQIGNIASMMQNAESLTDPAKRAAAKQNILKQINDVSNGLQNESIAMQNANIYAAGKGENKNGVPVMNRPTPTLNSSGEYGYTGLAQGDDLSKYGYKEFLPSNQRLSTEAAINYVNQATSGKLTPQDEIALKNSNKMLEDSASQLKQLADQFKQSYDPEGAMAPTSDEVMAKLQSTPGYATNLAQGEQTLARSQAARGILNSGNAAIEAQKFGADYATNAYQAQIANLSNLAGINMPVQQQAIGNSVNQGQSLQGQYNTVGGMTQGSMQDVARSRESAFTNSGNAQLQAALMNAQLQTQASMANAQMKSDTMGAAMGGIGSLMGKALGLMV